MTKLINSLILSVAILPSAAMADDDLRDYALDYFEPLPSELPDIAGNPVTDEKIELGTALFFDPRMSASGVVSCNSCHNLGTGGDDNMRTSIGHGWQRGPRNSPTVFNAFYNESQFWDGRAEDLAEQAKGPVQAHVEMANSQENLIATLKSMPQYVTWFEEAFPNDPDPVNFDNFARAIEAFEVTLVTPAPFDDWLNGDDLALSAAQQNGLELFMDNGCAGCHSGVNLGGNGYFPFGSAQNPGADILPPEDKGRFQVTMDDYDKYVFRVAPLRNVSVTAPYFHSGAVWDLGSAVSIMATAQLGTEISQSDVSDITAFLNALTGEVPEVTYPMLPVETGATPRPTAEVAGLE